MPRELVVVSPRPVELADLIAAGRAVDPQLGVRKMFGGAIIEFCVEVDGEDVAILSVSEPQPIDNAVELLRLFPDWQPPHDGRFWWLEATMPWDTDSVVGVAVAQELADIVGGSCRA